MDKMTLRAGLPCLLLACCLLLGGCAKRPIDGDIEGYWRLERFVTRADGQVHRCERIFYGITRYVVEVAERQGAGGYGAFVGRFEYVGGSSRVAMKDFRQRAATSDNGRPATPAELLPFGMDSTSTEFCVVVADGDRLVLESSYARLELTRF